MNKIKNNRSKEINDMVSIVKLASLLFTSIIFFRYLMTESKGVNNLLYQQLILIGGGGILLFLLAIYLLWTLSLQEKINKIKYRKVIFIESLCFITIFFIAVILFVVFLSLDYTGYKIQGVGSSEIIHGVITDFDVSRIV